MEGVIAAFRSLGPGRIMALFLGLAAVGAITTYMVGQVNKPGMALLYGGLNTQESGRIESFLSSQNIPHEVRTDGTVYVAADQVGQARLKVAGEGLVGGGAGYELFDNQSSFGTSNFVSNLNAKRALEGELARTISTLPAVQGARVHLVLPKQNLFSRETIDPSAAVALNLGARSLEPDQVRSIAQLVASSVPNLKISAITIIDQRGTLLFDGSTEQAGASQASTLRKTVEQGYINSLTTMLERVVGAGKVAVRVTADLNTEKVTEQAELYDPAQQVVRSEQTVESNSASNGGSGGVAGVQGNTPGGDASSSGGGASNETRTETTTNYEIGRTTRNLERMGGEVKKLSVAVLVEGKTEPAATEGGTPTYTALTDTEKNNLRTLVQTAIGFDAARGDRVEVVDMPFSPVAEAEAVPEPFLTKGQIINLAQYALIALVVALVGLLVVKPALSTLTGAMTAAAPVIVQQQANTPGDNMSGGDLLSPDNLVNISNVQGRVRESVVKKVTEIVDQYPEESLGVVRSWMAGNESDSTSGEGAQPMSAGSSVNSARRAAILILAMGEQRAAQLFSYMDDYEIRDISREMAQLGNVSGEEMEEAMQLFADSVGAGGGGLVGGWGTTERYLKTFLKEERVKELMEEMRGPAGRTMWEKLANVNEETLASYLVNEYPQTVAVIISRIKASHAAKVLAVLPEDLAVEVMERVLVMDVVPREVLAAVEDSLKTEFMRNLAHKNTRDTHELMAEIFNNFDRSNEQKFMGLLEQKHPDDAERIRNLMFTFDDIMKTDDKGIQTILRDVDKDALALALKGAKPEMREKFMKNMSERAAKILREDMEVMGPVKVKDVDEAQLKIVGIAKVQVESNTIVLISNEDGEEEFIT